MPPSLCPLRLVERYLLDNYKPHQLSTYALTLYRHNFKTPSGQVIPIGKSASVLLCACVQAGAGLGGIFCHEKEHQ